MSMICETMTYACECCLSALRSGGWEICLLDVHLMVLRLMHLSLERGDLGDRLWWRLVLFSTHFSLLILLGYLPVIDRVVVKDNICHTTIKTGGSAKGLIGARLCNGDARVAFIVLHTGASYAFREDV